MDGPQSSQNSEDDVQVDAGQSQQHQQVLQNSTPAFIQHCIYLGKIIRITQSNEVIR